MKLLSWLVLVISMGNQLARCEEGWWMKEPIRWVQTNLRETDATLEPSRLANELAGMRANVLLIGMGRRSRSSTPTRNGSFAKAMAHRPSITGSTLLVLTAGTTASRR